MSHRNFGSGSTCREPKFLQAPLISIPFNYRKILENLTTYARLQRLPDSSKPRILPKKRSKILLIPCAENALRSAILLSYSVLSVKKLLDCWFGAVTVPISTNKQLFFCLNFSPRHHFYMEFEILFLVTISRKQSQTLISFGNANIMKSNL